ncbi:MAG: hypothetical protein U9Q71_09385 [Pseudomonadota bacterium]|nr:hypothetical protein [Pseudomonadota bacterium]
MFNGLNKYGLPTKYAIICFVAGIVGVFLANMIGFNYGGASYISTPIAAGIGGAVGGWLRQRKGKNN